jgi:chaperonin GroES
MRTVPLRDRILVLPRRERDDVTSAGIIVRAREGIHDSDQQLGRVGKVIRCGPDVRECKAGDTVFFGEFEYPEAWEDGSKHLILQEADVAGVFE